MDINAYDAAVIGGGPAGAAAGWAAARRGWRTVIVERGDFPRERVCGEFLSAEAMPVLAAMIPEVLAAATTITTASWEGRSGARRSFALPRAARGLSRLALDAALWRAAGAVGCELRPHTAALAVERDGGGFTVTTREGEIKSRRLLVAAGRWWAIGGWRAAGEPGRGGDWIGVKARWRGLPAREAVEMYCFPGGYCGVSAVEGGWTNVCCLVHREVAGNGLAGSRDFRAWMARTARHPGLARRLEGGEQATETVTTAPVSMGPRAAVVDGTRMVGDASGFIDPFAGDGLARALLSGWLAVASEDYPRELGAAAGRGYRFTGAMRGLVRAPEVVQTLAVWALARGAIGGRLVGSTRFG